MAIRKDVNDMLNNLKQEEPPKEEKHVKSKFDNMSVDDLMNALNDGKEPPRKAPIRELKRIPSSKKNDYSKPENNNPPKKKKIVIGELPDYDAIEQQEIEKEIKKKNPIAENKKKDTVKENKDSEKKGFFARVKDLMYASADDEEETEEEKETSDDDTNGNFTVEEIKESSEIAIASIEEAISAINDNELVKDEEKTVSENEDKPKENKSEPVSKNNNKKKNNNKSKQNNSQKTKNSNSESETKPEKSEERKSETETEKPEEKKSESQIEKEEEKPETKTENTVDSEEKKEPPKNTSQSGSGNKKKKNRNKQKKDNQKPVKSSDSIIEDIQKDAEKAISEIENSDSSKNEKQEDSDVDTVVEETKNDLPDKEDEQTENVSEEQEENNSEEPTENTDDEIIVRISETPVKSSEKYKKSRYAIPALLCIVLAIIGVIAIVSTLISNIGGKDDFEKAVYPAVIMNIESFDSPSELTSDQIISATIWSVVIDDEKLSKYNEIMGAVNIPASDVEEYAVELFGEDIPELNHTTVGAAESRFYYNKDAQSYNVPIKPDTFTYIPEVTSVSKKSGEYVVNVNYIEEHPEWMEKSVAKEVQFRLSKNDNGGYKIDSMEVFSESSST